MPFLWDHHIVFKNSATLSLLTKLILKSLNSEHIGLASVNCFPVLILFYMYSSIVNGELEGR